ncbi:MAG: TRAP transporter small permease [Peptococcaceae bacterium]
MIRKCAEKLTAIISPINQGLAVLGAITLNLIMLLTTIDVSGRFLFNKPFIGTYECVEYGLVVTIFCGMAITQVKKQHVNVNILMGRLQGRILYGVQSISYLASIVIIILFIWGGIKQFNNIYQANQVSNILMIPQWPFQLILVIGVSLFCLTLLGDFLNSLANFLDARIKAPADDEGIKSPPAL